VDSTGSFFGHHRKAYHLETAAARAVNHHNPPGQGRPDHMLQKARIGGHFLDLAVGTTAWLGREDSNLRMGESKSAGYSSNINGRSEKQVKFGSIWINRVGTDSESLGCFDIVLPVYCTG
jgi:hypothetical protein